MQEPERNDGDIAEAPAMEAESEALANEPKAYAFDGWGMIPLELDPV